jgi:NTE family protein
MLAKPHPSPSPSARPTVALVLSSGGLNPLASIPMLEFLAAHGIQLDLMVGCSGGSLVLLALSCGYASSELGALFKGLLKPSLFPKDWSNLASMVGLRRKAFHRSQSVFKTDPIRKELRRLLGDRRMEDFGVPLILQATDFDTGEGVELDSGDLADAVYASIACYPFFHPIQLNGRWLFDGAFSAPLPILPAVRRGVDFIIAMDFSEKLKANPANFFEAMVHLHKIVGKAVSQSQMLASIDFNGGEMVYVKVRFPSSTNLWETSAYDQILEAGRQAVEEFGPEILAQIKDLTARQNPDRARLA